MNTRTHRVRGTLKSFGYGMVCDRRLSLSCLLPFQLRNSGVVIACIEWFKWWLLLARLRSPPPKLYSNQQRFMILLMVEMNSTLVLFLFGVN